MQMTKWVLFFALMGLIALPALADSAQRAEMRAQAGEVVHDLSWPWPFGRSMDSDHDGVPDGTDLCPDTPMGAMVDMNGCPMDADGDGVPDGLDQCAATPKGASVDMNGCPSDSDGDGVMDGIDRCGGTPAGAMVDMYGCPKDSDGDGVADGLDQCANTPKGATVDMKGCPMDSDGDGVPDGLDQCAGTPAGTLVDANGCPRKADTAMAQQLLDTGMIRTSSIRFGSGSSELTADSKPIIDEIGRTLVEWPELKIEIGGHTDSSGAAAKNQALSQARAQAVLDYLKAKFPTIKGGQYTVMGYGEDKPIADNGTADGRAANRRVEFSVLNREVLKK